MKNFKLKDVKKFMNLFLGGTVFDEFSLVEGTIKKYTTVTIDGHANEEFYKNDETHRAQQSTSMQSNNGDKNSDVFAAWSEVRPLCMELIKGRNTPLYMKFILQKTPGALAGHFNLQNTGELNDARSLILNITFSEAGLNLTTAVNFAGFYPDSPLPAAWDAYIEKLLIANSISYE